MTGAWACAVRPHRRGHTLLLTAVAVPLVAIAVAASVGLCVNTTASMPRGLWRVVPTQAPVARGVVVGLCPPDSSVFRQAARRGYIASGVCPGGYERLLKPVAAVAGDTVSVTAAAIAVNSIPVADTVALARDSAGRPLQPVPPGLYQVRAGEVWLLSGHDPRSFDSRYFGPVPAANIKGVARPLWVVR
jgi:conjugative transfer signal peptidase TraF